MLIVEKGDFDIDNALDNLKDHIKKEITEKQFSECESIIEKSVMQFSETVMHTESWVDAFTIFQAAKIILGRYLTRSLVKVFSSEQPYAESKETLEKAWDEFSDRYKIELDTRFGYMPDVMWSGSKYFTAVGWTIAGWLSQLKDSDVTIAAASERTEAVRE